MDVASATTTDEILERLCDAEARVVFCPVRHHSPACAVLANRLIESVRPAAVLIEGPSDFNPQFDELFLDHQLPIAIYSYLLDAAGNHRSAYYPFCDYSPEWQALQTARQAGAVVRFIDLPWPAVADLDRSIHRYADAELRRGRYVQALCDQLGVESFDELWDRLVENHLDLETPELLRRVHSFCLHIRAWDEDVSDADLRREEFMAGQIAAAMDEFAGRIVVVTGGFHSSALVERLEFAASPPAAMAVPASDNIREGVALTAYSYEQLDSLKGYDAGMPNPGFYEHAWRQRGSEQGAFDHRPLLEELTVELRKLKQTASTADLIAVDSTARSLAALRGRSHVWRSDLVDAVTTALIKDELEFGCRSPFVDAIHAVLRGERRGRLSAKTTVPPLVLEIRRKLHEADLEPALLPRELDLDLLKEKDRERSRLLHRVLLLDVNGFRRTGGTDFIARKDMTRLWESWQLTWSPQFDSSCIEAARYGSSLTEAIAARLREDAAKIDRSAMLAAELVVRAARAGIDSFSAELLDRVETLIAQEPDFAAAGVALGHLLYLYCHDEAFGTTSVDRIGVVLKSTFQRALWLFESIGQSFDPRQTLNGVAAMLETFERTAASLPIDRDEVVAVFGRVEGDSSKPPQVRGAATGVLWSMGAASNDRVLADVLRFANPEMLGDFLVGLFALAREAVQREARLLQTIDRLVLDFDAEEFQHSLPSLRLAFTYFTPREKHYLLTNLFESLGLKAKFPLAAVAVDPSTAAAALALEERIYAAIARYGLAGSPAKSADADMEDVTDVR